MKIQIFSFLFAVLYTLSGVAQENKKHDRFNLKVDVAVPKPVGNQEFRRVFKSLYKADLALTYNLGYGFFTGVTSEISRFAMNKDILLNAPLKRIHYGVGGRVGWQKVEDLYIFAVNLDVSRIFTQHSGYTCPDADISKFNPVTRSIEPGINFYFPADENFFVGFNLSYSILDYQFNLKDICLENYTYTFAGQNQGRTSYLNFGFGFIYNFKKGEGFD